MPVFQRLSEIGNTCVLILQPLESCAVLILLVQVLADVIVQAISHVSVILLGLHDLFLLLLLMRLLQLGRLRRGGVRPPEASPLPHLDRDRVVAPLERSGDDLGDRETLVSRKQRALLPKQVCLDPTDGLTKLARRTPKLDQQVQHHVAFRGDLVNRVAKARQRL